MFEIFLEERKIGKSFLEKEDASMGVISGNLQIEDIEDSFSFFEHYCKEKQIPLNLLHEEDLYLQTSHIPFLRAVRGDGGAEVQGHICAYIEGSPSLGYVISFLGIPHPFYDTLFESEKEGVSTP